MNQHDVRLIIGCWLAIMVLVIGAGCFFYLGNSSADLKRRVFRWYIVVGGVLVNFWFVLLGGLISLLFSIPLFAISALICIKTTRFCDSCGATRMNQFIRAQFCPRCGADLDAQEELRRSKIDGNH